MDVEDGYLLIRNLRRIDIAKEMLSQFEGCDAARPEDIKVLWLQLNAIEDRMEKALEEVKP